MSDQHRLLRIIADHDQRMESAIRTYNNLDVEALDVLLTRILELAKSGPGPDSVVGCFASLGVIEACIRAEERKREQQHD